MSNTILQNYLTLQFIPIDDESGVDKLNKSIEQLAKKLKKEKSRIAQFTLVAVDPNIPSDDEIIAEVQKLVITNWPVFVNKAGGNNLTTYNRVVILEALNQLGEESAEIAGIIWLTGSSTLKHYNLGREKEILSEWLVSIGNKFELEARKNWAISDFKLNLKLPELSNSELKPKSYEVNKDDLKEKMEAAAGSHKVNDAGQQIATNGNRYSTAHNPFHWVTDFGKLTSEAIATSINSVSKANNKEVATYLTESNKQVSEYLKQLKPYFEELGKSLLNKSNSLDLRSQLLWIKESQYSESLNDSYRVLESSLLPFYIAYDIAKIVPAIYPISIDFLAKEIARATKTDMDEEVLLTDAVETIIKNDTIKSLFPNKELITSRNTLYNFIIAVANGSEKTTKLQAITGLNKDIKITKNELLVWLLHEMQVTKLSNSK